MGPFLLMDKSSVQGLNFEDCKYIGRYYSHVISPILLRELTSMLAKKSDNLAEFKKNVSILSANSAKTNSPTSYMLVDAFKLAYNNLLGRPVPMDGRPLVEGCIPIITEDGQRGVFLDEPPEMQLLRNWADGHFSKDDMDIAEKIRTVDMTTNMESAITEAASDLAHLPKFKSLEEMIRWIDEVHFSAAADPEHLIVSAAKDILSSEHAEMTVARWEQEGRPKPEKFAPYALYFYRVNLIYVLGICYGLIKTSKHEKTHLDIQYIYYLPFCKVFTSEDNELLNLVPFFLRNDQDFVRRTDLKKDLQAISSYFSGLSEKETSDFYLEYGIYPPELEDSFTSKIWKCQMRPRPPRAGVIQKPTPEEEEKIMQEFKLIQDAVARHIG